MVNKISFNGTEYNSAKEMPPAVRAAYDRALELAAQRKAGGEPGGRVNVKFSTKVRFAYNGKTYDSPDQMPRDVREKYDKAMEQIDKDHNGVPDILESGAVPAAASTPAPPVDDFAGTDRSALQPLAPAQSVISAEAPSSRTLALLAGVVLIGLLIIGFAVLAVIQH